MRSHSLRGPGSSLLAWLALCCLGWLAACQGVDEQELAARQLGDRLLAPCCWRAPLNDHPSELADQLRREIQQRLEAGEAAAQIEGDLVSRYSERMRALPADRDPRWIILCASAALAGAGLFTLFRMVRPRLPLPRSAPSPDQRPAAQPGAPAEDAEYRLRLDEELAAVD
jgi:cytochrome c-type biogenesis protein CcmH/NrfF